MTHRVEDALQSRFKNMTSRQVFDLKAENSDLQDAMQKVCAFSAATLHQIFERYL